MVKKCLASLFLTIFLLSGKLYAEMRDPTQPEIFVPSQIVSSKSLYTLSGIIFSPTRKIAVINGQYLKPGDQILGERIMDITENTVQLQGPDGKITLFLIDKPIKRLSLDS